jgi:diacylglycerol O-acyltransferase / wax synthase
VRARPITLDRLSPEDVQILKREAGAICGHTCKVLILEPTGGRPLPTLEQLRADISSHLGGAPRLRQRLVHTPLRVARPVWLDDRQFDIGRHVTRYGSGRPVDHDQLELIVGELMTRRLDRKHPLWHIDVVEALADGTMALVWRIHHAMADGTASMRMGACMLWCDEPGPRPADPRAWSPAPSPGLLRLLTQGLADRVRRPSRGKRQADHNGSSLLASRGIISRELSRSAATTEFSRRVGTKRSVAFAQAPLEACKRAGKAIDSHVTLNDVVLAIVAGGIRQWLTHVQGPTDGIRVKVPVSLHTGEDKLANHDSYFVVDLPVAEPDPAKRVIAINRETMQRKLDHDAETLYRLGQHPIVSRWAMSPHVFTFNVSNVRGPVDDFYVLGARVRAMYSLAEIAKHHALRVSVISVGDTLSFGLCADRDSVKDLGVLRDGIRTSTDELLAAAAA